MGTNAANRPGRAFTIMELLVVIAVIATLMGILAPVMGKARMQTKVLAANAELRNIGLALEAYGMDNDGRYPPTRVDCAISDHYFELPLELVKDRYLPRPDSTTFMSAGIEDRFNRGYTYKYRSVGTLVQNRTVVEEGKAWLWVPAGFPDSDTTEGQRYANPKTSPVSWVLYSLGPSFDEKEELRLKQLNYPVPKATWYDPGTRKGVIVRLRLANGTQVGSF